MSKVTELGYLGLSVTNAAAWKKYATEMVGMELVEEGSDPNRFYLRMDHWHHRITCDVGKTDDLEYMGWRVSNAEALEAMAVKLDAAGYPFRVANEDEARERFVLGLLKLKDPSDNPVEIFWGPRVDAHKPFHPGRRMYGTFLTGAEGIGHCILRQDDVDAAYKFYSLLGLTGSVEYHLPLPNGMTAKPVFMHCNERQHSVAFGLGPMEKRINHMMIEYTKLDDLGIAHDIIRRNKLDVAIQLGKHSNDRALTFYHANPSGWLWELGWGATKSSSERVYYSGDIFGHGNEAAGYGMDIELDGH